MDEHHELINDIKSDLEADGAEAVNITLNYDSTHDRREVRVTYDGGPDLLQRHLSDYDGLIEVDVGTHSYPGGGVSTDATLVHITDDTTPGSTTMGSVPRQSDHPNTDTAIPSLTEDETEPPVSENYPPPPHGEPGTRVKVAADGGFPVKREMHAWPVRHWDAALDVPAILVWRYIPAPEEEYTAATMSWWSGYVKTGSEIGVSEVFDALPGVLNPSSSRKRPHTITYGPDGSGWIGWDSNSEGLYALDNQTAGAMTEVLAEAVRAAQQSQTGVP